MEKGKEKAQIEWIMLNGVVEPLAKYVISKLKDMTWMLKESEYTSEPQVATSDNKDEV